MKLRIISFLAAALLAPAVLHGQARDDQFKKDAFSQNYTDTSKQAKPDSSQLFSFRQYFGSLAHKRPGNIQNLFIGSTVFVGGGQIYNRQYWKLPVVYGGIGAGVGMGIHFNNQYKATGDEKFKQYSTWSYIGAGLVWWGSLMDMTANFKSDRHPEPGRSTLYSILLPGLGQIYNGEYWKVPIYMGVTNGSTTCTTARNPAWRSPRCPWKPRCSTATPTVGTGITPSWARPWSMSSRSSTRTSSRTCRTSRWTMTFPSGSSRRSSRRNSPPPRPRRGSGSPSDFNTE